MRRQLIILALLCCASVAVGDAQTDSTRSDMRAAKKLFIGWIDIDLDDWAVLGYDDEQAWSDVVNRNNLVFQRVSQEKLTGRQITGAKNTSDENADGQDLQVKFSHVRFDTESYRLSLSIHFIDPRSGAELASVPTQGYRGGRFSVDNCLKGALEKVADKITQEIQRSATKR